MVFFFGGGGHGKKKHNQLGTKNNKVFVLFWGGRGGKQKNILVKRWFLGCLLMKNLRTMEIEEDQRNIVSLVRLREKDFHSKLATFEGGLKLLSLVLRGKRPLLSGCQVASDIF